MANRYSRVGFLRWVPLLLGIVIANSLPTHASAQSTPTNAKGEEVFGLGYMPDAPLPQAEPLQAGHPLAGIAPAAEDMAASEALFTARFGEKADLPAEKSLLRRLPFRKGFLRQNSLPSAKFESANFTASPELLGSSATLKVHYVNVGQGAGAILEFPCGVALIDTGGEWSSGPGSVDGGKMFEAYLDSFFNQRPQLHRTIDVVYTSHPHEDHLDGLEVISKKSGASAYTVKNIVDNGQTLGKGALGKQRDFENWGIAKGAKYSAVTVSAIRSATGATNAVIDPFPSCMGVDPVITALWGADYDKLVPGIKPTDPWANPNNHSLVLRIDFGKASFLFVGDLQKEAAKEMLKEFQGNPGVFDVAAYAVSHHGAESSSSPPLVKLMSPSIAIISMGTNTAQIGKTAWSYGHPRDSAIDVILSDPKKVLLPRSLHTFSVATAEEKFVAKDINKAIYGTGWEDTVIVEARADGTLKVISGQQ